ncbi:MAG: efflux RND transporter periplasmic adaptor subunit [Burkholderiaceae bacterium]|nr:efflux RND transporter periplasmic adaptor subunit [Burkholderiaceae bacterium]
MKPMTLLPAFAAALLATGCAREAEPRREETRPVRTEVVGARAGSVDATYSGAVLARHEARLGFQVSGRIVARLVELGSPVRRGQPLMRLDPAQETLHLAAAAADVDAARHRVEQNRIDLQRTEQLLARRFASPAEVDQQRLALAESESQLRAALAQQQIKANQRGYTELVADRDGVVSALGAEVGQVVAAGQQVLTLAADGEREVQVSVPESRVDELRRARSLQVTLWALPGRSWRGALRELAPDTDSVTRTYSARISIREPDDAMRLGMTASVRVADVDGDSAIRLPLAAIHDRGGQPQVWVLDAASATVQPRPVTLGAAQNEQVIVSMGLQEGETVVTAGVHMLVPGQKVKTAGATGLAMKEP